MSCTHRRWTSYSPTTTGEQWRRCRDCKEYMSLGPATLDGKQAAAVAIEIRAAEIAATHDHDAWADVASNGTDEEATGWAIHRDDRFDRTYVDASLFDPRTDAAWAGWLGREIYIEESADEEFHS